MRHRVLANAKAFCLYRQVLEDISEVPFFLEKRMKNFLKSLAPVEWFIWIFSIVSIVSCFCAFKNTQYLYLAGSLIGATALIFVSKGNPIGQFLTIVFSVFYGIIAFSFKYYGEMITYLGMSAPIALWAFIAWLRNPYHGKKSEVRVNTLSFKEK